MKRYKYSNYIIPEGEPWNKLEEDPNGEWVKYEDAQKEIDAAFQIGQELGRVGTLEVQSVECNCIECANNPHFDWWVCPAHGYKRR